MFLKESDGLNVFTCCLLSHYYLDARLVLFLDWASQQHVLFTATEVLDEELIRIRTRRINTSITFILFIPFAGGFHAL